MRLLQNMRPKSCIAILSIGLFWFPVISVAENVSETWADFNFVPCEGVGVHGSGRIKVSAEITRKANSIVIHNLRITSAHPHSSGFNVGIEYQDEVGKSQSINLVHPWYPTMGPAGDRSRVLPRNKTMAQPGPAEQMEISVGGTKSLLISANVLFSLDGGNCAANFSETWRP